MIKRRNRDRFTTSSDGTRSIERDHPDEDAPDVCPLCARDLDSNGECPEHGDLWEATQQHRDERRLERDRERSEP